MLEVESTIQADHQFSEPNKSQLTGVASQASPDAAFDPKPYFDRWFADVHACGKQVSAEPTGTQEFYVESIRGSSCEVTFEGVLHFDGYTLGNIRSPDGTLVLAKEGRVDADIDVARAVISGSVTGNISAPEGVVLDSDARVAGQIHTRMLSVRVGALFEGDCMFAAISAPPAIAESSSKKRRDKQTPAPSAPSLASGHTPLGLLIDQRPVQPNQIARAKAAAGGKRQN